MDSRRSACAMGKWVPPLAKAIFSMVLCQCWFLAHLFWTGSLPISLLLVPCQLKIWVLSKINYAKFKPNPIYFLKLILMFAYYSDLEFASPPLPSFRGTLLSDSGKNIENYPILLWNYFCWAWIGISLFLLIIMNLNWNTNFEKMNRLSFPIIYPFSRRTSG